QDTVLIVEDDAKTAHLLATYLERDGFRTEIAIDGLQGLARAKAGNPSCIILDLMLPELDGWEVCREVRRESEVPILMLSAREEATDRIAGLMLGADDYVCKPFSPQEIVARVRAILRRSSRGGPERETLGYAGLRVDTVKHRVWHDGRLVDLTPSEFLLLKTLMAAPGRVFSRSELLGKLYPNGEAVIDRVVDVHIGKLRQKVEPQAAQPAYVLTVRGVGYCFTDAPPPPAPAPGLAREAGLGQARAVARARWERSA
ncbi:MAG: DNA-binding response OmpR family regulator, partial [Gammaproteobacteria bacterium]